jgi:Flp pilus assembly protein TadG
MVIGQGKRFFSGLLRQDKGAAAVEFAIVMMVLLMLLGGILDLGHAWYMRQVVTNASREGARYGITYRTDTNGNRIPPCAITPTIESFLLNNYLARTPLPAGANPSVAVGGAGYPTGNKGDPLEVQVAATKQWFLLQFILPGFVQSEINLRATTVMECE